MELPQSSDGLLNIDWEQFQSMVSSVRNEFGGARGLGGRGVKTSHRPTDLDFELVWANAQAFFPSKWIWYNFSHFNQRSFPSASCPLESMQNHEKKKCLKNSNLSQRYGCQDVKDPEGEDAGHVFEAGDHGDWYFFKIRYLCGSGCL